MDKGEKKAQKGRSASGAGKKRRIVSAEVRLRAVKLFLEEGLPAKLICGEFGVHKSVLSKWVRRYREGGEDGLKDLSPARSAPPPSSERLGRKIAEVKRQQPSFGVKRISQWLRRALFVKASPETVRKTLHRQGLMPKAKKKTPRNPPKPRFFERSKPNQLWQSDIFTFRLGGRNAYLIGFVDDYSRYVVGLGLYRGQSAEHVLEVYRTAVSEYGVPKEVLTDQGRQYANWRGKTRFQQELTKDRVQHLMSRPHHPMTLGKVERFWKTLWEEFLVRAQFGSFEEAWERVRFWVQHYNHRRPHQGLGGMCPADRFFEIQQELRKVIEAGMKENALALALDRAPKEPFYMVGRMGGQSVVLRVEKGQFRMQLDDGGPAKEAHYKIGGKSDDGDGHEGESAPADQAGTGGVQRAGEGRGGALLVDGAAASVRDLPGDEDRGDVAEPVAGAGDGGYARSPGAEEADRRGAEAAPAGEGGAASGPKNLVGSAVEAVEAPHGAGAGEGEGGGEAAGLPAQGADVELEPVTTRRTDEPERAGGAGPAACGDHRPGAGRETDGDGGGAAAGRVAQDLLPVGAAGARGDDGSAPGQGGREAVEAARPGEGGPPEAPEGDGGAGADPAAGGSHPLGGG
jgi:transposase InsO family protein